MKLPGAEFFEEIGPEDLGLLCYQRREQRQSCLVDKGDKQSRRSLRRGATQIGGDGFGPGGRLLEGSFASVAAEIKTARVVDNSTSRVKNQVPDTMAFLGPRGPP